MWVYHDLFFATRIQINGSEKMFYNVAEKNLGLGPQFWVRRKWK